MEKVSMAMMALIIEFVLLTFVISRYIGMMMQEKASWKIPLGFGGKVLGVASCYFIAI